MYLTLIIAHMHTAYFFFMVELTGEGRACIPVGLTKTWDGLVN